MDEQYKCLEQVFADAVNQAACGKGKERHTTDEDDTTPFDQQISSWIQGRGFDYARGQAVKKLDESLRMPPPQAVHELQGALNCIAIAILDIQKDCA